MAQFISFISLFETQTHIHNNLNFKNSVQNQFLSSFKIQFPKNLDLRKSKEKQYKINFSKFQKYDLKLTFIIIKKNTQKSHIVSLEFCMLKIWCSIWMNTKRHCFSVFKITISIWICIVFFLEASKLWILCCIVFFLPRGF